MRCRVHWHTTPLYGVSPRRNATIRENAGSGCWLKLSPEQQADILAIIAKYCPVDDVKFDHYVIDWDFD